MTQGERDKARAETIEGINSCNHCSKEDVARLTGRGTRVLLG